MRLLSFQAPDPKFVLALEPRVLKLENSFIGISHFIYVLKRCSNKNMPKRTHNSDFRGELDKFKIMLTFSQLGLGLWFS